MPVYFSEKTLDRKVNQMCYKRGSFEKTLTSRVDLRNALEYIAISINRKYGRLKNTCKREGFKCSIDALTFAHKLLEGCKYCGEPVIWHSGYSIDRKNPKDTRYSKKNTVAACKECNMFKRRKPYFAMLKLASKSNFTKIRKTAHENAFMFPGNSASCLYRLYKNGVKKGNWKKLAKLLHLGKKERKLFKYITKNKKARFEVLMSTGKVKFKMWELNNYLK